MFSLIPIPRNATINPNFSFPFRIEIATSGFLESDPIDRVTGVTAGEAPLAQRGSSNTIISRLLGPLGSPNRSVVLKLSSLLVFSLVIWFGLSGELSRHARLAFIIFGLAVAGWIFTKVNGTYIALAAAISFTLFGVNEPDEFFDALGDSTVWLLLAAFIIAAGITSTGLSNRLTSALIGRAGTVNQLFYLITAALIVTAFVIPATSGRAALMIPVFLAISSTIDSKNVTKGLALLFPTIILLSAVGSLIGAGAHLITAEILWKMGGEQIGFAEWMMLGLPFALVSCFASTFVILRVFLTAEDRSKKIGALVAPAEISSQAATSLSRNEKAIIFVVASLVLLWLTQPIHGINNTIVAVVGALIVTAPGIGVIDYKASLKSVNWNLLLFMAAALELGEALIESKAAEWLTQKLFGFFHNGWTSSSIVVISGVAIISLLSHLLITSRTARASVLIPLIVLLAVSLGYNPTTLAFLATAAAGYCLTLPVSAKPVTMFSQIEGVATYEPADLMRLSKYLLPIHFALLILFAYLVWPQIGLTVRKEPLETVPQTPLWHENVPRDADRLPPGGVLPITAPTPWAIFGDYNREDNRLRLRGESPAPEVPVIAPTIPEPTPSVKPTATPPPERTPQRRRPAPRRAPVADDDDDDG